MQFQTERDCDTKPQRALSWLGETLSVLAGGTQVTLRKPVTAGPQEMFCLVSAHKPQTPDLLLNRPRAPSRGRAERGGNTIFMAKLRVQHRPRSPASSLLLPAGLCSSCANTSAFGGTLGVGSETLCASVRVAVWHLCCQAKPD